MRIFEKQGFFRLILFFILLYVLGLFMSPYQSNPYLEYPKLTKIDGKFFKVGEDTPYTGETKVYLYEEIAFVRNFRQGMLIEHTSYSSGILQDTTKFDTSGIPTIGQSFFPTGKIHSETIYHGDTGVRTVTRWDESGNVAKKQQCHKADCTDI